MLILIILVGAGFLFLLSSTKISYTNPSGTPQTHLVLSSSLRADFVSTADIGVPPLTIRFIDRSSGAPTSRHWDFDDGNTSDEREPIHTFHDYAEPYAVKNVTLTIQKGQSYSSISKEIRILPPYPIVDFGVSPLSGPAPLTVNFSDVSYGAPGDSTWHFGDGRVGYLQNISYTYNKPGVYSVELTVTCPFGARSKNKTITVL